MGTISSCVGEKTQEAGGSNKSERDVKLSPDSSFSTLTHLESLGSLQDLQDFSPSDSEKTEHHAKSPLDSVVFYRKLRDLLQRGDISEVTSWVRLRFNQEYEVLRIVFPQDDANALHVCATAGNRDVMRMLLALEANQRLIKQKAHGSALQCEQHPPFGPPLAICPDANDKTPLFCAILAGHREMAAEMANFVVHTNAQTAAREAGLIPEEYSPLLLPEDAGLSDDPNPRAPKAPTAAPAPAPAPANASTAAALRSSTGDGDGGVGGGQDDTAGPPRSALSPLTIRTARSGSGLGADLLPSPPTALPTALLQPETDNSQQDRCFAHFSSVSIRDSIWDCISFHNPDRNTKSNGDGEGAGGHSSHFARREYYTTGQCSGSRNSSDAGLTQQAHYKVLSEVLKANALATASSTHPPTMEFPVVDEQSTSNALYSNGPLRLNSGSQGAGNVRPSSRSHAVNGKEKEKRKVRIANSQVKSPQKLPKWVRRQDSFVKFDSPPQCATARSAKPPAPPAPLKNRSASRRNFEPNLPAQESSADVNADAGHLRTQATEEGKEQEQEQEQEQEHEQAEQENKENEKEKELGHQIQAPERASSTSKPSWPPSSSFRPMRQTKQSSSSASRVISSRWLKTIRTVQQGVQRMSTSSRTSNTSSQRAR
jgi:hypothetical protein